MRKAVEIVLIVFSSFTFFKEDFRNSALANHKKAEQKTPKALHLCPHLFFHFLF